MKSKQTQIAGLVILAMAGVLVLAGCGGGTASTISGRDAVPTITTISPTSTVVGSAGFTLTVKGTNFVSSSVINFGGAAAGTTFVSSTQLTTAIPAAAIASAGTAAVTVTNPAPGGGTSNPMSFAITSPNPVPTITSLSPSSIAAGGPAFTLTVFGSNFNFVPSSVVQWNGSNRPTTFLGNGLTAQISASDIAKAGTATVTVFNPTPGGGTSNAVSFTVGANPVPTINSLDPSCAPVGAQAFTLWVSGSNFVPGSVVRWNGSGQPTTVTDSFDLTAQISASDIAATGTAAVTVFNPPPGGGSSNTSTFTMATGAYPQSIAVDPTGKFAYVADQGCPDTFAGKVSMFTIDPHTGALTSAGTPVDTGDFGADSVTVDTSGKFVYVANWGAGDTSGSVSFYIINATTGALTSIGTIQAPCAPSPGSCAPWSVVVHPSGKFVYVANEGGLAPTSISMYSVDPARGALAYTGLVAAGGRAVSVTVHPSGKFAYVATDGGPGSVGDVSMYTIDTTTGALTSIGTIAAGTDPSSVAVDPSGKFAYVTNSGSNDVSTYSINTTTGALTSMGPIAAGTSPSSVAVDPTSKFAYVTNFNYWTNSGSNDVSMYTIDATNGTLTSIGTIAAGSGPTSIAIHPSGKFAYVTNSDSNSVSIYAIDAATGALTLVGTIGT